MGYKYIVVYKYGNTILQSKGFSNIFAAIFQLLFEDPGIAYTWKALEVR